MERNLEEINLKFIFNDKIDPSDFTENKLFENNLIDSENKLDRSQIRVSAIGTNFIFDNTFKDEIKIQSLSIVVRSKSMDRISLIINALKSTFGKFIVESIEFTLDEHFISDDFPESIFDRFSIGDFELDVIRVEKEDLLITMWNCKPETIHIKIRYEIDLDEKFTHLDWESKIDKPGILTLYNEFVEQLYLNR